MMIHKIGAAKMLEKPKAAPSICNWGRFSFKQFSLTQALSVTFRVFPEALPPPSATLSRSCGRGIDWERKNLSSDGLKQ